MGQVNVRPQADKLVTAAHATAVIPRATQRQGQTRTKQAVRATATAIPRSNVLLR
jgi:hypothetical protein